MMGIVMPETCWAVSVRQSNKILRLIVASSWVFYLSGWRCTEPQTLKSVSDVVTLRGNFIWSRGAFWNMLPGSRYDSWAKLYSKNSLLAFESLNQFPVSLYERWSTVWFAQTRLSKKPTQYLHVAYISSKLCYESIWVTWRQQILVCRIHNWPKCHFLFDFVFLNRIFL